MSDQESKSVELFNKFSETIDGNLAFHDARHELKMHMLDICAHAQEIERDIERLKSDHGSGVANPSSASAKAIMHAAICGKPYRGVVDEWEIRDLHNRAMTKRHQRLSGIISGDPSNRHDDGSHIITSAICSVFDSYVETKNSILALGEKADG